MYFKRFPTIYYPVVIDGEKQYVLLKDITINVRVIKEFLSNITLYDLYDIVDGETPEIISEKFYGTPLYHWVVMIVNEKFSYIDDFPLTYPSLLKVTEDKYGKQNVHKIHHYENTNKFVVSPDYPLARPVSNLEYEEAQNENKRTIKIIDKSIIERVVSDFIKILK